MDGGEKLALTALLALLVFIIVFAIVTSAAHDLGAGAPVLGVVAALGTLAAIFGALKVSVHWPR